MKAVCPWQRVNQQLMLLIQSVTSKSLVVTVMTVTSIIGIVTVIVVVIIVNDIIQNTASSAIS